MAEIWLVARRIGELETREMTFAMLRRQNASAAFDCSPARSRRRGSLALESKELGTKPLRALATAPIPEDSTENRSCDFKLHSTGISDLAEAIDLLPPLLLLGVIGVPRQRFLFIRILGWFTRKQVAPAICYKCRMVRISAKAPLQINRQRT
jgi:hypothetical protein